MLLYVATPSLATREGGEPSAALYVEFMLAARLATRVPQLCAAQRADGAAVAAEPRLAAGAHRLRLVALSVAPPAALLPRLKVLRSELHPTHRARGVVEALVGSADAFARASALLLDDAAANDDDVEALLVELDRSAQAGGRAAAAAAAAAPGGDRGGALFFVDGAGSARKAAIEEGLENPKERAAVDSLVSSLAEGGAAESEEDSADDA